MFPSFLNFFGGSVQEGSPAEPDTNKVTDRGYVNEEGVTAYAFSGMQGWRVSMEDAHIACAVVPVDGQKPLAGHSLFGVMDGHGGSFTSETAEEIFLRSFSQRSDLKLYANLSSEEKRDVPGVELLRLALADTFGSLDIEIRGLQNKKNEAFLSMSERPNTDTSSPPLKYERSGSTCVVVMLTPSHIICANAGDSRAILRRGGKTLPLSFDHKPSNIPELMRIQTAGGFVKAKRVDGDLAVSRGLGDFSYKAMESLPVEQQKVIPDPQFIVYPRNREKDEFVIIACDGVWDVATNAECSNFVQELVDEGESDLGAICEEAMDTCLQRNSRDNMTIGIVGFSGMNIQSGLNARNVVWKRRTSRQAKAFEQSAKSAAARAAAGVGIALSSKPAASVK
jgi:serine/threonine protein phosphatase PrpC